RRGDRGERLVRKPRCDARPPSRARVHPRLFDAAAPRSARARAVARDAEARGVAHVAGTAGIQLLPPGLAHDDSQGSRILAAPARAPYRPRARARGHAGLMDANIRVAELPASRGMA